MKRKELRLSQSDLEKKLQDGKIRGFDIKPGKLENQNKKKSKYSNEIVVVDGHTFRSKKEANRYFELKCLLLAGVIRDLRMQVPYELNEGGTHSVKYYADFVYIVVKTGEEVVEDAKGYRTVKYQKKKKLMKKIYGIEIKEV